MSFTVPISRRLRQKICEKTWKPKEEKNNLHYTEPKSGISKWDSELVKEGNGKWKPKWRSKKPENIHSSLGSKVLKYTHFSQRHLQLILTGFTTTLAPSVEQTYSWWFYTPWLEHRLGYNEPQTTPLLSLCSQVSGWEGERQVRRRGLRKRRMMYMARISELKLYMHLLV